MTLTRKEKIYIVSQLNCIDYEQDEESPQEWKKIKESIIKKLSIN